jgi:hypothetical protein
MSQLQTWRHSETEVIPDTFNVVRICTNGNQAQKLVN